MSAIILLLGPTASGKTATAMALQDALGGPEAARLISVDSAMVYRGLDIGSAKPEPDELLAYPHDLIDIRDPEQPYTVAEFVTDADRAVQDAIARNQRPILIGGTMLYAQRFLRGLAELPSADEDLRAELEEEFERDGGVALHATLAALDPVAAAGIDPRNRQRLLRAVEVVRLTGAPLSTLWAQQGDTSVQARLGVDVQTWALVPEDRSRLHERIVQRFEGMLERGFLEEVAHLKKRPRVRADHPSMRSVGYRQAWQYLEGVLDREAFCQATLTATRRLAKRQLTWLRRWDSLQRLNVEAPITTHVDRILADR